MSDDELTFDELCDLGAEQLYEPCDPQWRDVRHQGVTPQQYHRVVDVPVIGEYL